jgi:hypothetical protein
MDDACPVCGGALKGKVEVTDEEGRLTTVFACATACGRFIVDADGLPLLGALSRLSRRRISGLLRMAAASGEPFHLTAALIRGDA